MPTFTQVITEINQGKLAPVYLVLGTEEALKEKFKTALEKQIPEELNQVTIDLNEQPLSDGLLEATSVPFFGDKRFVFFEHPSFLTGSPNTSGPVHDVEALMDYLKDPLETSIVVFFAPYEKLDERKKVVKALKKVAVMVDTAPLKEAQIRSYLAEKMQETGLKITPQGIERLLLLTQLDLMKVEKEVDKLALYQQTAGEITEDIVNQLVARTLQDDVFSLAQYVIQGQTEKALRLYQDLLTNGEELIKLNGILISQIRLYLQVKILVSKHRRKEEIASLLKVHPYRVKLAMGEVGRLSLPYLARLYDDLINQDFSMKQSQMDKELGFEFFLLKNRA